MPEFTESIEIYAPAERTFEYLRDPTHLPEFVPSMTEATPLAGGSRVRVRGSGRALSADANGRWEVDHRKMRVTWGADGRDYHGSLTVSRAGQASRVDALLHFGEYTAEEIEPGGEREWQAVIGGELALALRALKAVIERGGAVVTPGAPARPASEGASSWSPPRER